MDVSSIFFPFFCCFYLDVQRCTELFLFFTFQCYIKNNTEAMTLSCQPHATSGLPAHFCNVDSGM